MYVWSLDFVEDKKKDLRGKIFYYVGIQPKKKGGRGC